jgi:hypothetical protein
MTQVIDALVVELGLDPKNFTAGQRAAIASFKQAQEESRRIGNEMEAHGKKVMDFFGTVKREVLGGLAIFFGGRAAGEFINYITNLDATTGRLSKTLNVSTHDLSAWQNVMMQTGGTVDDARESIGSLSNSIQTAMLTQNYESIAGLLSVMRMAGVAPQDYSQPLKILEAFSRLADQMKGTPEGAARFAGLMRLANISPQTINTLLLGHDVIQTLIKDQDRLGTITDEDAAAAIRLQKAWGQAETAGISFGSKLLNVLAPTLATILETITNLFATVNNPNKSGTDIAELSAGGFYFPPDVNAANSGDAIPPIRVKHGAGKASPAMRAVMNALAGTPGINEVTSLDDVYHQDLGGAHPAGRALDIAITDPTQSAAMAAAIKAKLAAQGINATVIDEYLNPSAHATGGHIHVGVNEADAARLAAASRSWWEGWHATGGPAMTPIPFMGAAAAGVARGGQSSNSTRSSTVSTHIDTVNVTASNADVNDASAQGVRAATANVMDGMALNVGPW